MNDWTTKKKLVICEADDFMDRADRNGLNYLFYWKARHPKFKISLFTVPDRTSPEMLSLIDRNSDWIELLVHGWDHESNFECYGWDYERTKALMHRVYKMQPERALDTTYYKKFFKAPGWTITPGGPEDIGGNGYAAGENDPLKQDHTQVYRALRDMNFVIFDRHYNKAARPSEENIVCVDCQPDLIHFHTWNVPSGDINGRNGFEDIERNFGVPWDENTEFKFVSEAWEEGLFKECHN